MPMTSRHAQFTRCFGLCLLLLMVSDWTRILAAPIQLTVDTNRSSIRVSIDAFGKRDTQESRISGWIDAELDPLPVPSQVAIGDFSMRTVQRMNFSLDFSFLGKATAKVNDLQLTRIETPASPAFVPLTGVGGFTVDNVRYQTFGDGSYALTGLPCSLAQGAGRDCQDAVDFDSGPPGTIGQMTGKVEVKEGKITLEIEYFFSQPLDPQTPDFATVSGPATIVATGDAVVTPVKVRLDISSSPSALGSVLLIRWPAAGNNMTLVASPSLEAPIDWQPVEVVPVLNTGFLEVRLHAKDEPFRYFRLQ